MYSYYIKKYSKPIALFVIFLALYYFGNICESFTQAKKKSVGSSDVCSSATNCNACHTLSNTHPNGHDCFWCKTNSRCVDLDNYPDNYPTDNNCSLGC
jgi:hypothetical protein